MGLFSDMELSWGGVDRAIPATHVLRLIAKVEEIITLDEMIKYGERGAAPVATVALAYGAILRYAGYDVTDDEVYASIRSTSPEQAAAASQMLLTLLMPPSPPKRTSGVAKRSKGKSGSAKRRTKRS